MNKFREYYIKQFNFNLRLKYSIQLNLFIETKLGYLLPLNNIRCKRRPSIFIHYLTVKHQVNIHHPLKNQTVWKM